jgi:hypothetical protein
VEPSPRHRRAHRLRMRRATASLNGPIPLVRLSTCHANVPSVRRGRGRPYGSSLPQEAASPNLHLRTLNHPNHGMGRLRSAARSRCVFLQSMSRKTTWWAALRSKMAINVLQSTSGNPRTAGIDPNRVVVGNECSEGQAFRSPNAMVGMVSMREIS